MFRIQEKQKVREGKAQNFMLLFYERQQISKDVGEIVTEGVAV